MVNLAQKTNFEFYIPEPLHHRTLRRTNVMTHDYFLLLEVVIFIMSYNLGIRFLSWGSKGPVFVGFEYNCYGKTLHIS